MKRWGSTENTTVGQTLEFKIREQCLVFNKAYKCTVYCYVMMFNV